MHNPYYPDGFNIKLLDGPPDLDGLPDSYKEVKYRLVVECGSDEEEVFTATYNSEDDLIAEGLARAAKAIEKFQYETLETFQEEGIEYDDFD